MMQPETHPPLLVLAAFKADDQDPPAKANPQPVAFVVSNLPLQF